MKLLYITEVQKLMGLRPGLSPILPNPDEMAREGYDAESVEWAKKVVNEYETATRFAAVAITDSSFASLSLIAQPSEYSPMTEMLWEKKEVRMWVSSERFFTIDMNTFKVTGYDNHERKSDIDGEEYTNLPLLWQLADKARNRAADCLN